MRAITDLHLIVHDQATGCNKWLDAKPKTLIESEQLFKSEKGFEDAMYGVYTKMAGTSLYGDQLTMSFLEVLAQQYNCQSNPSHNFYQAANYNYLDAGVKSSSRQYLELECIIPSPT